MSDNGNGNGNGMWFRWVMGVMVIIFAGALSFVGAEIHSANTTIDDVNRTLVSISMQVGDLTQQIGDLKVALKDAQNKLADVGTINYRLTELGTKVDSVQTDTGSLHDKLEQMEVKAAQANYRQGIRLDHIDASADAIHANQILAPVTHSGRTRR